MDEYIGKEQVIEWFRPYGHIDEKIPYDVLVADIREMKAADVAPVQQWIPVTERLPELPKRKRCHRSVIASIYGRAVPIIYMRDVVMGKTVERWLTPWFKVYDNPQAITHWMPIPEPPKGETE